MVRRWLTLSLTSLVLVGLSACSSCIAEPPDGDDDAGVVSVMDDGGQIVAGDAGQESEDAGEETLDAGRGSADAGSPQSDGGEAVDDAGTQISDAGMASTDGGAATDAGVVPPECTEDATCNLGELCVDGSCVVGCRDARDCQADFLCDVNLDDNGRCVTCVANTDCADGERCFDGNCLDGCTTQQPDCPGDLVCDTANEICVECVQDAQCALGNLCFESQCVPGCTNDRDCPDGRVCGAENLCIEGCSSNPDSCPLGAHCNVDTRVCDLGCNADNDRCPDGQNCIDNVCENVCTDAQDCLPNETCDNGSCVLGCFADEECSGRRDNCTETGGLLGECVECVNVDDCRGGQICLAESNTCSAECTPGANFQCFGQDENVCAPDGICVACLVDDDCNEFSHCNTDTRTCESNGQICDPCTANDQCNGGLCVRNPTGADGNTRICAESCANAPCGQGFSCELLQVDGVALDRVCVPTSTAGDASCASYRNFVAESSCYGTDICGPARGGQNWTCQGVTWTEAGVCGLWCVTEGDCPSGFACTPGVQDVGFPGPPDNAVGTCQPD